MLITNKLSSELYNFIKTSNNNKVPEEKIEESIRNFCNEQEKIIYDAIKSATITIPPGSLIVVGANGGGPVSCTNAQPIILNLIIS